MCKITNLSSGLYTLALVAAVSSGLLFSCKPKETSELRTTGSIERMDSAINQLIDKDAVIEILSEGYEWSEGPVWVASHNMLLFSDVPTNTIYKWTADSGTVKYLTPSGYTGAEPSLSREPGSNGLALTPEGKLAMCQHGDRRIAMMDAPFETPAPDFITLADNYNGKKLDSPNDLTFRDNGDLFFTDPPYGLPQHDRDSTKEMSWQGVYKRTTDGQVMLLVDSLTRPNGIALTPDEKTFILANSDPRKAIWYAFDFNEQDSLTNARIFYDATANTKTERGLPDGFRIDQQGNVFASG